MDLTDDNWYISGKSLFTGDFWKQCQSKTQNKVNAEGQFQSWLEKCSIIKILSLL